MTKYDGINTVKTDLSQNTDHKIVEKQKSFLNFWTRLIIAIVIVALLGVLKYGKIPYFDKAAGVIKESVCYDINGRNEDDFGEIKLVSLIKELLGNNKK